MRDYEKMFSDWKARRGCETGAEIGSEDTSDAVTENLCEQASELSTLYEVSIKAKELQETLLDKIYGQEHAVRAFVSGYFQAKMQGMMDTLRRKPAASFLFVGASGVGKTFLAETAAEALQCPFARFDMSEYADKDAVIEFAGADGVYKGSKEGNVTGFVRKHPRCVLIFDEIEKAHMNVLHLFLQILDAGRMRDSCTDQEVFFDQTMIILTTNAGSSIYDDTRNTSLDSVPKRTVMQALRTECDAKTGSPIFPAALCSRFASGNVILFNRMEVRYLKQILEYRLKKCVSDLEQQFQIQVHLDDNISKALIFAEGGMADARAISGRGEKFLSEEIYELFQQVAFGIGQGQIDRGMIQAQADSGRVLGQIDRLQKIYFSVDFRDAALEVRNLFQKTADMEKSVRRLARYHQVVDYKSTQRLAEDGTSAEVFLTDFQLRYAVEGVDSERILAETERPNVTFDEIIGAEDAKEELRFFIDYMKHPQQYIEKGFHPPKGVLLHGVPGTGKTMLAKAMATEADMTFMSAEGSQFLKKYVGEGPEAIHALFRTARKYAPTILFIDEIDAIGKNRQSTGDSNSRADILNALLTEMSGFKTTGESQVFVLAATNFDVEGKDRFSLDSALLRRFDRKILVDLPNREERLRFLKQRREKSPALAFSDEEADRIAAGSAGMTLSRIKLILGYAMRCAAQQHFEKVTDDILDEAFASFDDGQTEALCSEEELKRIARHEAGHAFICWQNQHTPAYLTVMGNKSFGGYMLQENECRAYNLTRKQVYERIREALAGRATEIVFYGKENGASSGAADDLKVATQLAEKMIGQWGMDDTFGMAVIREKDAVCSDVESRLRERVNTILQQMLGETVAKIKNNKESVDLLAEVLIRENHMDGRKIRELLESKDKYTIR